MREGKARQGHGKPRQSKGSQGNGKAGLGQGKAEGAKGHGKPRQSKAEQGKLGHVMSCLARGVSPLYRKNKETHLIQGIARGANATAR